MYCYEFESYRSNANKSVSDVRCCGIGDVMAFCSNKKGGLEVQTEKIGSGVMLNLRYSVANLEGR